MGSGYPRHLLGLALLAAAGYVAAAPCAGVDRTLSAARQASLAPALGKQLGTAGVEVRQSFRSAGWSILYVATPNADPGFLFFSADPLQQRYRTIWSGMAQPSEAPQIRAWALRNAPGIPSGLAACFAWYVAGHRSE